MMRNVVLAITGASGAIYAVRLLDVLVATGCDVQLAISPAGRAVLRQELGLEVNVEEFRLDSILPTRKELAALDRFQQLRELIGVDAWQYDGASGGDANRSATGRVHYHHYQDFFAAIASGSARTDGMVVCPCSGGTLSAIAHGASGNLIHRAADVHLKERRRLILVPRETPLSLVQLDNMRRAAEAGAIVLPAMPGFYHGVHAIRDLVDFVVARICDQLDIEQRLIARWGES
ncbi:MAG TPA: flavin prenyltransferase UbiX [Pirellulales bacterium]|nr:flavin prenyltransferase UbiX [Pirellulales bacterium]